ncbi:MAG: AAC(3) family N-acetyltransferase [Bacteroidales bacterium]|nr:AAC(3) family N-acetyltransferase [Bacteroidales bacterium]
MFISRIIFRLFPPEVFISLREIYRTILKTWYAPFSELEFRKILTEEMGISKGSIVFVHSSIDNLNIRFDTFRLLEILLETVGEEGTLVFPCWHFTYRAEDYLKSGKVFDVRRSPSALGMLSEMARRYPGAKRSLHPINSIVAIGRHADTITSSHHTDIYPCGEKSPYYLAMQMGGIIAGIGVNANFMSFVHCPEDVIKLKFPIKTRLDEVFEAKVKKEDGTVEIVKTLAAHPQIKNNNINDFLKKYIPSSISRNITIRGNRFFITHPKELFDSMIELSKENKTIYTKKAVIKNT